MSEPNYTRPKSDAAGVPQKHIRWVAVDLIRPGRQQARRRFDPSALDELARSIAESGVVQPVVLRSAEDGYELLAGERRWRASQIAGLASVPAIVRDDLSEHEATVLGLIENLQRESLSPTETAEGLKRLGEAFALTHDQIAERIGKSRTYVTNFLRVLKLVPDARRLLDEGGIALGHAKILAGLPQSHQRPLAFEVVRAGLSVRALEKRCAAISSAETTGTAYADSADMRRLEQQLTDLVGNPVRLQYRSDSGKGNLRIDFSSLQELQGVLARLGYREDR